MCDEKHKQKYLAAWEKELDKQTDINGNPTKIGDWCSASKKDSHYGRCNVCHKDIIVSNMGHYALIQHAAGTSHKKAFGEKRSQLSIPFSKASSDGTVAAEIRWVTFLAEHDLPMSLSDDIAKLFVAMFPDSAIAREFKCARTKSTYVLTSGLGNTFHDDLITHLRQQPFSMLIDESNQVKGDKYLNILLSLWMTEC